MKLNRLESIVQEQAQLILQLQTKIERLEKIRDGQPSSADDAAAHNRPSAMNTFVGMPTSCEELKQIGHSLNGFYSVKGTNGMKNVYCDFSKTPRDNGTINKFVA
jgi:hypothetical protein